MGEPVPYESATSGAKAREEISTMLRRLGCERVGFMDEFDNKTLLLAFSHRGRDVHLRASASGWAAMYLRRNPHTSRMRRTLSEHRDWALKQGMIAVNSILRDWVKGQVVAVECGILSVEAVFMPHMIGSDGRTMIEHITSAGLLPPPKDGI